MKSGRATSIRVLSYNIHKGFTVGNRRNVLDTIRGNIRTVQADVVFLQEVLGHHRADTRKIREWPNAAQFEYLADEIWKHYAYGKNAVYHEGHHGNALLSKFPIVAWENVDISAHRVEQRGLLHAEIGIAGRRHSLHAICIHLGLLERWRKEQIERLCRRIEERVPAEAPLIIAGDFNDWRKRATALLENRLELQEAFLSVHGDHAMTYPSKLPAFRLDRIYYRGLDAIRAQRLDGDPWNRLSDHTPLLAELVF